MATKTLPLLEEQSADQEGQCTADDCCCESIVSVEEPQATVEEAADCGPDTCTCG